MNKFLKLILLLAITIGSFFIAIQFIPSPQKSPVTEDLDTVALSISYWIKQLDHCTQSGSAHTCDPIRNQLILNLRQAKEKDLYLNRKGFFSIFLLKKHLIYLKENCNAGDTAIDMFPVNYYPYDPKFIPSNRVKAKLFYLSHIGSFKKTGFRNEGACLMVSTLQIPAKHIKKLQTGQFQRKKGWAWNIVWINPRKPKTIR